MSAAGAGGGNGTARPVKDCLGLRGERDGSGRAVGFGGAFDAFGREGDAGQVGEQGGGLGEGHGGGGPVGHRGQPG